MCKGSYQFCCCDWLAVKQHGCVTRHLSTCSWFPPWTLQCHTELLSCLELFALPEDDTLLSIGHDSHNRATELVNQFSVLLHLQVTQPALLAHFGFHFLAHFLQDILSRCSPACACTVRDAVATHRKSSGWMILVTRWWIAPDVQFLSAHDFDQRVRFNVVLLCVVCAAVVGCAACGNTS